MTQDVHSGDAESGHNDLTRALVAPESSDSLISKAESDFGKPVDGKKAEEKDRGWRDAIPAMACCMALLFVAKIVQQGALALALLTVHSGLMMQPGDKCSCLGLPHGQA